MLRRQLTYEMHPGKKIDFCQPLASVFLENKMAGQCALRVITDPIVVLLEYFELLKIDFEDGNISEMQHFNLHTRILLVCSP